MSRSLASVVSGSVDLRAHQLAGLDLPDQDSSSRWNGRSTPAQRRFRAVRAAREQVSRPCSR
jgi:hypothetical protein